MASALLRSATASATDELPMAGHIEDFVKAFLSRVCELLDAATDAGQLERWQDGSDLLLSVMLLRNLMYGFSNNASASEAAERLKVTRPGLYVRLEKLGLSTTDFQVPEETVGEMMLRSEPTMELVGRLYWYSGRKNNKTLTEREGRELFRCGVKGSLQRENSDREFRGSRGQGKISRPTAAR